MIKAFFAIGALVHLLMLAAALQEWIETRKEARWPIWWMVMNASLVPCCFYFIGGLIGLLQHFKIIYV